MNRKTRAGAGWRAVFLRALADGRSPGAAAVAAGVHYLTPFNLKRREPAFAADWAAAAERGRAKVAAGDIPALAADEVVGRSKSGPCIRKAGATRWSAGKERRFLDELAVSANVTRAAAAAGLSRAAIVKRRQREPALAEQWDAALAQGWAVVAAAVVRAARVTLEGVDAVEDGGDAESGALPPMTVAEALQAQRDWLRAQEGRARRRPGPRPAEPSIEEVRDEILRRVRAMQGRA